MPCALPIRSEEHTSELQSPCNLVCRVLFRSDRKSTRLNSSHLVISYAVFCLKKKMRDSVLVSVTETTKLSIGLMVGASGVRGEVSAVPALRQTEQTTLGRVVDSLFFFNLPAATRIYTLSIRLSPGI